MPMDETQALDAATEKVAQHVLRHLEWQPNGFSLIFLFADVGPALRLATWLDARLVLSGNPLQRYEVDDSFVSDTERDVDALTGRLAELSRSPGAVWFGVQRYPTDDKWNRARRRFISRINERRFLLERDLDRPLILVLPVSARPEVAAMAPDLWHIRTASHQLRTDGRSMAVDSTEALERMRESVTAAVTETPAYDEWRKSTVEVEPSRVFLPLSQPAIAELLSAGRPADAMEVANAARGIAQSGAAVHGTPEALRDLSVSLDNVGRVARAQGDWAQAERVYRESLEISRQLIDRLGGTPEALRDLSVSLDNVGRVASAQGDWGQAERVYRESLEISRQLIDRLGGTPEALRDLSVSLNSVGRVASAQGDWAQAERVYRESLEIRRQLIDRLGGTPEALRDLSVSLNNVGRVARAQGDWAHAERVYRESLQISRQLIDRLGGTPEALSDLAIALRNVGHLPENDRTALAEAAAIYRELSDRFPMVVEYKQKLSAIESEITGAQNAIPQSAP